MASLITSAEKSALNSVMNSVHDTFSRLITIYKDATQTVTTQSASFNSIYGNAGATTSITYTPQSSQIYAAILYARKFDEDYFSDQQDSQLKIKMQEGRIRVKIKASDYNTAKDGKRFEFDGQQFFRDSDFRAHGLFDVQFYTFYVKSSQ